MGRRCERRRILDGWKRMKGRGVSVSVELEARDDDQTAKAEQSENKRTFFFCWSRATRKIIIISAQFDRFNFPVARQSADTKATPTAPASASRETFPPHCGHPPRSQTNACPAPVSPETNHIMTPQHHSSELTIPALNIISLLNPPLT